MPRYTSRPGVDGPTVTPPPAVTVPSWVIVSAVIDSVPLPPRLIAKPGLGAALNAWPSNVPPAPVWNARWSPLNVTSVRSWPRAIVPPVERLKRMSSAPAPLATEPTLKPAIEVTPMSPAPPAAVLARFSTPLGAPEPSCTLTRLSKTPTVRGLSKPIRPPPKVMSPASVPALPVVKETPSISSATLTTMLPVVPRPLAAVTKAPTPVRLPPAAVVELSQRPPAEPPHTRITSPAVASAVTVELTTMLPSFPAAVPLARIWNVSAVWSAPASKVRTPLPMTIRTVSLLMVPTLGRAKVRLAVPPSGDENCTACVDPALVINVPTRNPVLVRMLMLPPAPTPSVVTVSTPRFAVPAVVAAPVLAPTANEVVT